jgi:hypothetical protein
MTYLPTDVKVSRKGIAIVFSWMSQFKIENREIQMQEEGVNQKNSKTKKPEVAFLVDKS